MRALPLALVAAAACGPGGRSPTTVDAPPQMTGDAPAMLCYSPSTTGTAMDGNASIQSCAIWNNVANMNGMVTLTRDHANLTMAFANGLTFTGTITGTSVQLQHYELHDFSDGCTWRATETLTGTIDETSCVMMLSYAYVETVEVSNGACATPCSGTADFNLQITPIF
jgi:hypothetical protein